MTDPELTPAAPGATAGYDPGSAEFGELRELLVGPERQRLEALERRVEAGLAPEALAERLPEAVALRTGRDRELGLALAPTIEGALRESIRRNPRDLATAIFPVLGPAIRKAIAEAMAHLVRSINVALEHSFSPRGIRWRLEAWRSGVPFAQVVLRHALVYRVEQVFLIHAETGILLAHAAPAELKVADADLVSGMLTAIQDFVSDSFKVEEDGGRLRSFSVGELSVLVEPGPGAVLAAVVRGQPSDALLRRLQDTVETLHVQFGRRFAEFDGDAAPFEAALPLLEACLETVLATDRVGPRRRWAWLGWAVPLAIGIGALAVWLIGSERRWRRALDRLAAEPGLVVVDASRRWGGGRVDGLRDPLAADPAAVAAGAGLDSRRVEWRWRPYLSLEPSLVRARARQLLGVPAAVDLALRGDTLVATGAGPIDWLARLSSGGMLPPGVSRIDLSGVTPVLGPALAADRASIEGARILFSIGSAEIGSEQRAAVSAAAAAAARVLAGPGLPGYRVMIVLEGRTDATGTDAANQSLSRLRAEAVARALATRGVPPAALSAIGLGTARPLGDGADPEARAEANRSVTFRIEVTANPGAKGP